MKVDEMQRGTGLVPHLQSQVSNLECRISGMIPDLKDDVDTLRKEVRDVDQAAQRRIKAYSDNFKRTMEDLETRNAEADRTQEIKTIDENQYEMNQALKEMIGKTEKPSPFIGESELALIHSESHAETRGDVVNISECLNKVEAERYRSDGLEDTRNLANELLLSKHEHQSSSFGANLTGSYLKHIRRMNIYSHKFLDNLNGEGPQMNNNDHACHSLRNFSPVPTSGNDHNVSGKLTPTLISCLLIASHPDVQHINSNLPLTPSNNDYNVPGKLTLGVFSHLELLITSYFKTPAFHTTPHVSFSALFTTTSPSGRQRKIYMMFFKSNQIWELSKRVVNFARNWLKETYTRSATLIPGILKELQWLLAVVTGTLILVFILRYSSGIGYDTIDSHWDNLPSHIRHQRQLFYQCCVDV